MIHDPNWFHLLRCKLSFLKTSASGRNANLSHEIHRYQFLIKFFGIALSVDRAVPERWKMRSK